MKGIELHSIDMIHKATPELVRILSLCLSKYAVWWYLLESPWQPAPVQTTPLWEIYSCLRLPLKSTGKVGLVSVLDSHFKTRLYSLHSPQSRPPYGPIQLDCFHSDRNKSRHSASSSIQSPSALQFATFLTNWTIKRSCEWDHDEGAWECSWLLRWGCEE